MELNELKDLLSLLSTYNVTQYKSDKVELTLSPSASPQKQGVSPTQNIISTEQVEETPGPAKAPFPTDLPMSEDEWLYYSSGFDPKADAEEPVTN